MKFFQNIKKYENGISYSIIIALFLISRIPFIFNPIPLFVRDSVDYFSLLNKINLGITPTFELRTPGYPIFLLLLSFLSTSGVFIIFVQNLLTLCSSLFLFKTVKKIFNKSVILIAIGIAFFISSPISVYFDSSLLTESLYISLIFFFFGFLIKSFYSNKNQDWFLTSLFSGLVILVRPNGSILLIVLFISFAFFFINKFQFKNYLFALLPALILVVGLCSYNFITIGYFAISKTVDGTLLYATSLFVDKSDEFPENINMAIEEVKSKIAKEDMEFMSSSWNFYRLYKVYYKYYGTELRDNFCKRMGFMTESLTFNDKYLSLTPLIQKINNAAIKQHFDQYVRLYFASVIAYYYKISNLDVKNFYKDIQPKIEYSMFVYGNDSSKGGWINEFEVARKYYSVPSNINIDNENKIVLSKSNIFADFYGYFSNIYNFMFRNIVWSLVFFVAFFYNLVILYKSKFKSTSSFILFLLGMAVILNSLLTSLILYSEYRYSFPLEFIYYISLPMLWDASDSLNPKLSRL